VAATLQSIAVLLPGVESGNFMSRWPDYNVPVPGNTTFKINKPEPGQIKTDTGDPIWRVYFRTGTPLARLDLIALDDTDLPTENFFEYTTLGSVNGSPMKWRGNNFSFGPFKGLNVSGGAVPEGRYQILASALRINGNADERGDWDIVALPSFIVEYK
jgi:hypothetical protein